MARRTILILAAALAVAALLGASPARAQDNHVYALDREQVDVAVRGDGGVDIEYQFTFTVPPGADPKEVIDVGLPNRYYDLNTARAWIDGQEIGGIRASTYIPIGVEIHLGRLAIPPGHSGVVRFKITNPHMVYPDREDPNFASVEFFPTWFSEKFARGTTRLEVRLHLPAGAKGNEVKWHYRVFDDWLWDEQRRLTFIWREERASPSQQYRFGASFRRELVDTVFESEAGSQSSGPTPSRLDLRENFHLILVIGLLALTGLFFIVGYVSVRRQRMQYFPPLAAVEGGAISKSLSAPEVALVLETPLARVTALLVLNVVRKGGAKLEPGDELRLTGVDPRAAGLRNFERKLLACVGPDGTIDAARLKDFYIHWILSLRGKMKSCSLDKTRDYYRLAIAETWGEVEAVRDDQAFRRALEDKLEWLLLDSRVEARLKQLLANRLVPLPAWWGRFFPDSGLAGDAGVEVGGKEFASALAQREHDLMRLALHDEAVFSAAVGSAFAPMIHPHASGTVYHDLGNHGGYMGGLGGGSCACACACAGCACACAGGGR